MTSDTKPPDTAEQQGRHQAEAFRATHDLGVQPLGDLVALIEQFTGVDVAVLDAEPDEHGLLLCDPATGRVFMSVARTPNPMRQRSTLGHELAHFLFEDWTVKITDNPDTSPEETRAAAFARHLLLPQDGLLAFVGSRTVDTKLLSGILQRFLVSPVIAAIALHQAGLIATQTKDDWAQLNTPALATQYGWLDQYRALQAESDQTRTPQRLLARAITGYTAGVVTIQTLATLQRRTVDETSQQLQDAGITQEPPAIRWTDPTDLPAVRIDPADLEELNDDES